MHLLNTTQVIISHKNKKVILFENLVFYYNNQLASDRRLGNLVKRKLLPCKTCKNLDLEFSGI